MGYIIFTYLHMVRMFLKYFRLVCRPFAFNSMANFHSMWLGWVYYSNANKLCICIFIFTFASADINNATIKAKVEPI